MKLRFGSKLSFKLTFFVQLRINYGNNLIENWIEICAINFSFCFRPETVFPVNIFVRRKSFFDDTCWFSISGVSVVSTSAPGDLQEQKKKTVRNISWKGGENCCLDVGREQPLIWPVRAEKQRDESAVAISREVVMFYLDWARSHLSLFVILLLCALFQSLRAASAERDTGRGDPGLWSPFFLLSRTRPSGKVKQS